MELRVINPSIQPGDLFRACGLQPLTLLNHVDELPRLREGLEDPRIKPRRAQAIQPKSGPVPDMLA